VVATLMSYRDKPVIGRVESIAWGIAQQDGSTGFQLLPSISPTFEWIRLAQRLPVRVRITEVPEGVVLRVGTTCSVLVETGTAGDDGDASATPVPRALQ
jgi:multidrug resistance efflux pump